MDINSEILTRLKQLADTDYARFTAKLVPTVTLDRFIGVRTPVLRHLARDYAANYRIDEFLTCLPHHFFEQAQLHAFIIALSKEFDQCITRLDAFLPHVDNWATCDQLSPRLFKRNRHLLRSHAMRWLDSEHIYTRRFAIVTLMNNFLDTDFNDRILHCVAAIRSDEYYITMAQAWYLATALAKQPEATLPLLDNRSLHPILYKLTIRKAVESFRVSPELKLHLKQLRT